MTFSDKLTGRLNLNLTTVERASPVLPETLGIRRRSLRWADPALLLNAMAEWDKITARETRLCLHKPASLCISYTQGIYAFLPGSLKKDRSRDGLLLTKECSGIRKKFIHFQDVKRSGSFVGSGRICVNMCLSILKRNHPFISTTIHFEKTSNNATDPPTWVPHRHLLHSRRQCPDPRVVFLSGTFRHAITRTFLFLVLVAVRETHQTTQAWVLLGVSGWAASGICADEPSIRRFSQSKPDSAAEITVDHHWEESPHPRAPEHSACTFVSQLTLINLCLGVA